MEISTPYAKLVEMEKLCKGNPEKIAAYTRAKREYDDTVAEFFNDEQGVTFVDCPSGSFVEQLEERAKESGDERDKARAIIMRDRYDYYEGLKTAHIETRTNQADLVARLQSDEPITRRDVETAHRHAKLNPTPQNIAMYTRFKRRLEAQTE